MLSLKEYIALEEQKIIETEEKKAELRSQITDFFKNNEVVTDKEFHKFAAQLGIDVHEAENIVYELMSEFWGKGKYNENPDVDVDPDQLAKGLDVEAEHSSSPETQRKIVLDHLSENPRYYDYLEDMENKMAEDSKIKEN